MSSLPLVQGFVNVPLLQESVLKTDQVLCAFAGAEPGQLQHVRDQ